MHDPECAMCLSPRFSDVHGFEKPNDKRALDLMDAAAKVGTRAVLQPGSDCYSMT